MLPRAIVITTITAALTVAMPVFAADTAVPVISALQAETVSGVASRQPDVLPAVIGTWVTENGRSKIEIANCGDKLCGTIIWLKEPLDAQGKPKLDFRNRNPDLRSRELIGLPLLENFSADPEDANRWQHGTIYNPEDGDSYKSFLTLIDQNNLKVEGCVLFFCKERQWVREGTVTQQEVDNSNKPPVMEPAP